MSAANAYLKVADRNCHTIEVARQIVTVSPMNDPRLPFASALVAIDDAMRAELTTDA